MTSIEARSVWLPEGWRGPHRMQVADGRIVALTPIDGPSSHAVSWLLPGLPNLHSHAFQRAMAGHAERRGDPADSFWSWRETMYACAARMTPETLYAIACQAYVEMLEAGYTWVCEFHYLHHQADGTPYDDPAAMSRALIAAARHAGIGLSLLPVLYMTGGFDGRPLNARQRRFGHTTEAYVDLVAALRAEESPRLRIGIALHSLRAVPADAMADVLAAEADASGPIHIHIAEQIGEVQDCLAVRDARPVEWLLDHAAVDERWCLVHATHLTREETRRLADSGATVALCPTTEANLGDGLFPLRAYLDDDGAWGIGSDSHISISPVEELRWLEYGQRLVGRHRNIAASEDCPSVGETLLAGALHGGRACAAPCGSIEPAEAGGFAGSSADLVALDAGSPLLAGHGRNSLVDTWLFAGNRPLVDQVWTGGKLVVDGGRHRDREAIAETYRRTVRDLFAD